MDALFFCGLLSGHGALTDKTALKFSKSAKHVHHHATRAGACVYRLCEALKRGTRGFDALQYPEEVYKRSSEAVYFVDNDGIPWAQTGHELLKLRPSGNPAAFLLVDATNTGTT